MLASRFGAIGPAALSGRALFAALLASFLLGTPPLRAACVFRVGNCNGGISGSYVTQNDPNAVLKIDSASISLSAGPLTISYTYTVKSIEGNQVLIEVSEPGGTQKTEALLIVDGDTLHAKSPFFDILDRDWKRK